MEPIYLAVCPAANLGQQHTLEVYSDVVGFPVSPGQTVDQAVVRFRFVTKDGFSNMLLSRQDASLLADWLTNLPLAVVDDRAEAELEGVAD